MSTITSQEPILNKPKVKQQTTLRIPWGKIASYAILIIALIYLGPLLMLVNTALKPTHPS